MVEARPKLVRIPLVPVAVAMVVGILAGRLAPLPTGSWALLAGAGVVAGVILGFRPHLRGPAQAALLLAVAGLSAIHAKTAYFAAPEDHIVACTGAGRTLATLRGRIVTAPEIVHPLPDVPFTYHREPQTIFLLDASRLGTGIAARPVTGLVRVTIDEAMRQLRMGQEVDLVGWIGRFRPPNNPGQYDSAEVARIRGVLVWCTVAEAGGATVVTGDHESWLAGLRRRMRAAAAQHFAGGDDEESGLLTQALVVGQRHPALGRLNEIMVQAGIAHFLSIAGTHLAIFLGFIYLLCRLATLSRRRASGVVLAALAAYLLVAEPNPPLLRSAIMAGAVCLAALTRRQVSGLNALSAAAILLLALAPMDVFAAGFQLSFGIVLGLMLLQRPIHRWLWGRWLARQGLAVYRHDGRARRWLARTLGGWARSGISMGVTAWIVSVPLAAWHFGLFSPYGQVLTSLLMLPVAAVLVPGYLSLALAWPAPNFSDLFARLAEAAAAGLARIVDALRFLPGLCIEVRPVGPAWAAMCYIVVALWVLRRRVPRGTWAAGAASLVLAGWTVYSQLPARAPEGLELHLLAVGNGQCAVVRTPAGATWLFDAGTRSTLDAAKGALEPFLHDRCFARPHEAFVSHANSDHFSALADLAEKGWLRRVYLNEYWGRAPGPDKPPVYEEILFLKMMETHHVQVERLSAGRVVPLDGETRVEVLWPPPGAPAVADINDTSLILRVVGRCGSILFPGDAGAAPLAALAAGPAGDANRLHCEILVMPHHGTWSDDLPAFVRAARPKAILVSRSADPHPPTYGKTATTAAAADFYPRLFSSPLYHSTAKSGWIRAALAGGEVEIQTMR
jgi:competence protein ComEC